ncbi:LCP family protein [Aerococcaceae bacterium DSM 111022]|nr:LCP family protein [Aerococcaceae bacterium DSM 111022]
MKKFFFNNKGKFSWLKLIRNVLVVVIVVAAAFAGKVYRDVRTTLNYVSDDITITELREEEVNIEEGEPINVLLIGTDGNDLERTEDEGFVSRSDTLMLINLNPETKQTQVLSIPRDSLATVEGEPDKINHAFAYGGAELTIETVQDFLQVPIDYYATIDMSGLEKLIDAIGGIEVTSPLTFEYRGTGFVEGETREVNGVKAMNFARMRYDDPEGEVGRQNRQKIVIKAIVDKILSPEGMSNLSEILQVVNTHVKTNVNLQEALDIYQSYIPALDNINVVKFDNMEEIYLNEVFYFHIPLNERVRVANEFRHQSYLAPITSAQLTDPVGEGTGENDVKTLAVVINQYPTGMSDEELSEIINRQEEIQTIRSTSEVQQTPVWTAPVNNTNQNNNSNSTTPSNTQPVEQTPPTSVEELPVSQVPEETPVESTPPESTPAPTTPVDPGVSEPPAAPVEPAPTEPAAE